MLLKEAKDFYDLQSGMVSGNWEPGRHKAFYRYDYGEQQVVIEWYRGPLNEKILEWDGRDVEKYKSGELMEKSYYYRDGSLRNKDVNFRQPDGKKTSVLFTGVGAKVNSHDRYKDTSGAEFEDYYDSQGKLTSRTVKSMTPEGIVRVWQNYGGSSTRTVTLYDPQTELEKQATSYLGDQVTARTKIQYEFDPNGNWIRQVEFLEVTRFGTTNFEPQTATLRKIIYRQAESVPAKRSRQKVLRQPRSNIPG